MANKLVVHWDNLRHALLGGRDLGGETNDMKITAESSTVRHAVLHSRYMKAAGGLRGHTVNFDGIVPTAGDFGAIADKTVVTMPADIGQLADVVYFGETIRGTLDVSIKIGELYQAKLDAPIDGPLVRGAVLRNAILDASGADNPDTGAATGTSIAGVAIAAGQKLAAAVHLLAFTGTSITFAIQTDDVSEASWLTKITLGPLTAAGSAFGTVAGPITDTRWRVVTTGTFTSATFLVAAGRV